MLSARYALTCLFSQQMRLELAIGGKLNLLEKRKAFDFYYQRSLSSNAIDPTCTPDVLLWLHATQHCTCS